MKRFKYTGREIATDKRVKSVVQAENEIAAGKLLIENGISPIEIKEEEESIFAKLNKKVPTKDKIIFTRQLATLIGAGLPLTQAMHTVMETIQNKTFKSIVEDCVSTVESGKSLGEAFGKHPEVFDKVYLALVAAGEISGTLDDSLKRIADQQEKDAAMMSKIRGAMTYPLIVVLVIFGVMGFMLFTVVPQVEQLYEDLGEPLPTMTAIMVGLADFIIHFWWVVILILVGIVLAIRQAKKTEAGIQFLSNMKLNAPMFGQLMRKLYMARYTRTTQTLMASGVSMLDTMRIAAEATNNPIVQEVIDKSAEKVKGGKPLSEALTDQDYILPLVPQMANIGEQSGKMDEMMGKAAQVFEDDVDEQIASISTMIEPILMLMLAVMAGGMIGAILFPIYGLVNSV